MQKIGHMVSQRIYLGGVKAFFDGSLGSNSALFYEVSMQDAVITYLYFQIIHFKFMSSFCLGISLEILVNGDSQD